MSKVPQLINATARMRIQICFSSSETHAVFCCDGARNTKDEFAFSPFRPGSTPRTVTVDGHLRSGSPDICCLLTLLLQSGRRLLDTPPSGQLSGSRFWNVKRLSFSFKLVFCLKQQHKKAFELQKWPQEGLLHAILNCDCWETNVCFYFKMFLQCMKTFQKQEGGL